MASDPDFTKTAKALCVSRGTATSPAWQVTHDEAGGGVVIKVFNKDGTLHGGATLSSAQWNQVKSSEPGAKRMDCMNMLMATFK